MKISKININRYGPLKSWYAELGDGIEVIYGPNESGKTLLLESVLRILNPNVTKVMDNINRVQEHPLGSIFIESNGEELKLGEGNELSDIHTINALDLRNIFVIRDSDLRMKNTHQFYSSITERIGNIHTSEIKKIKKRLKNLGRITSKNRNLSRSKENDYAREVHDDSKKLSNEIKDYIEEAKENNLDDLEGELIKIKAEIDRVKNELKLQTEAKKISDYNNLSNKLETVKENNKKLRELADVSRDELENLNTLDQEIKNKTKRLEDLESETNKIENEIKNLKKNFDKVNRELKPLKDREQQIDEVSKDLENFRDTEDRSSGAKRLMKFAQIIAFLGIGLGGVVSLLGILLNQPLFLPSIILLGIGIFGLVWYYHNHRNLNVLEKQKKNLLRKARDANLRVNSILDISPAIEGYREKLDGKNKIKSDLESKISLKKKLVENNESQQGSIEKSIQTKNKEKKEILNNTQVNNTEEYKELVNKKEELEGNRLPALQSLKDYFGEPESDKIKDKIRFWDDELKKLSKNIELEDVDPNNYNKEKAEELENELKKLNEKITELKEKLRTHRRKIESYKEKASEINSKDFIDENINLKTETIEGLIRLTKDLDKLVSQIELDGDISIKALEIFDELQEKEEDKITDLFEPKGRTSSIFKEITNSRYKKVEYDVDNRTLKVYRDSGDVRVTDELSKGTRQQLYLAARISLAEQILEGEPGFFLMDEAFLPSDRRRLIKQFGILRELIKKGWQIIYFTAKKEVGEEMVKRFSINSRRINQLP